jgi:glycolate oxidase iron-sulfur subunit
MEGTRAALAADHRITPWWQRRGLGVLRHHRLLLVGATALALAQRVRLVPRRVAAARLPVRRGRPVVATGGDVWLFTGCVMDAWFRGTHRSTAAVLTAMGVTYSVPGPGGGCCGALHAHAGLHDAAAALARDVMASMQGGAPILVNSAGCGAALRDVGHLLGTAEAEAFAARVHDVHEWIEAHADLLPPLRRRSEAVVVQDPCHLRHVQRVHGAVRGLLGRVAPLVELDDDGLCCGAGGAYSALQPELAADVRARKLAAIDRATARSGATVVASANPGCAMHLAAGGLEVRHPIDLVAESLA